MFIQNDIDKAQTLTLLVEIVPRFVYLGAHSRLIIDILAAKVASIFDL